MLDRKDDVSAEPPENIALLRNARRSADECMDFPTARCVGETTSQRNGLGGHFAQLTAARLRKYQNIRHSLGLS